MKKFLEVARGGKNDDNDDYAYQNNNEDFEENEENDSDVDKEVDFDKPTFGRDQIWNDYAEDLDFDE